MRKPLPASGVGPGLAVRIAGDITAERLNPLQEADDICTAEINPTLCSASRPVVGRQDRRLGLMQNGPLAPHLEPGPQ